MSNPYQRILKENNITIEPDVVEFIYPIYKKSKSNGCIIKFTGLNSGVCVKYSNNKSTKAGTFSHGWIKHTSDHWEDIDFKEDISYPIYKRAISSGLIVKFDSPNTGDVIYPEERKHMSRVGWIEYTSNLHWRDLTQEELSNYTDEGDIFNEY